MCARFQVLTAASVKMNVFWNVALRSLVEVIALMMEAASTSETSQLLPYYTVQRSRKQSSLYVFFALQQ
jgi:hypothetical protein